MTRAGSTPCVIAPARSVPAWRDLFLLVPLSLSLTIPALTAVGLSSWHEAQRAQVVREMWERSDWIVPTVNNQPYLAKPPLFYWAQMIVASVRGGPPSEADLRIVTALFGTLGVAAVYLFARRLLDNAVVEPFDDESPDPGRARRIALWSAAFLATGPLYTHASRVGELDITLPFFVTVGIGGLALNWQRWTLGLPWSPGATLVATLGCVGAAMAKGPPGLMVIAIAVFGGAALHAGVADAWPGRGRREPPRPIAPPPPWLTALGGLIGLLAFIPAVRFAQDAATWLGCGFMGLMGALAGVILSRLVQPARLALWLRSCAAGQPWVPIGLAVLSVWLWGLAVAGRIGAQQTVEWAQNEMSDNLNPFWPMSAWTNVWNSAFGVGIGSFLMIGLLARQGARRSRISTGGYVVLAWVVLGILSFSMLTRGFVRYLVPIWPGIALCGGIAAAWLTRPRRGSALRRSALVAATASLAAGLFVFYVWVKAPRIGNRSPRELITELRSRPDLESLEWGTLQFQTAAVDYYLGRRAQPLIGTNERDANIGGRCWSMEELIGNLRSSGRPMLVLLRDSDDEKFSRRNGVAFLRGAGLRVEPVLTRSSWVYDNGRNPIIAALVSAP